MDIFEKIKQRNLLNNEIKREILTNGFFDMFERTIRETKKLLSIQLVGKELRYTRGSGPFKLENVIIPLCYDAKHFKKHGQMLRLILKVKVYEDGNSESIFPNLDEYKHEGELSILLDVPLNLITNYTDKKMDKWIKDTHKEVKLNLLKYLNEKNDIINKDIKILETNY